MAAILTLVTTVSLVVAFFLGFAFGTSTTIKNTVREMGLTKESVQLYRRAGRILNRLVNVTDLDGDLAGDILSPTTRKQVNDWLTDYKKEINKV